MFRLGSIKLQIARKTTQYALYSVKLVPLMMKDGAVKEPMLPRKLAIDLRYADHDCVSAGGTSAKEEGMSGILVLLDIAQHVPLLLLSESGTQNHFMNFICRKIV